MTSSMTTTSKGRFRPARTPDPEKASVLATWKKVNPILMKKGTMMKSKNLRIRRKPEKASVLATWKKKKNLKFTHPRRFD